MRIALLVLFLSAFGSQVFGQIVEPRFDSSDRFILVGDSFTNGGDREWAGKVDASDEFLGVDIFATAGHNLNQIRSTFVNNYDVENDYTAIVIAGGVNDIANDRTAAAMRANVEAIIAAAEGDEHIIITTVAPSRGVLLRSDPSRRFWNVDRQAVADEYDAWVRGLAGNSPNVSVFDLRAFLDADNDQDLDDEFFSASADDFLHPQNCDLGETCGSSLIADAFVSQFAAIPEPSSGFLLVILSSCALFKRRRFRG